MEPIEINQREFVEAMMLLFVKEKILIQEAELAMEQEELYQAKKTLNKAIDSIKTGGREYIGNKDMEAAVRDVVLIELRWKHNFKRFKALGGWN